MTATCDLIHLHDPAPGSAPSAGIRRASAEASSALGEARGRRETDRRRRQAVQAVDELINALEDINLTGRGRQPAALTPGMLLRLEVEADRPLPAKVSEARTPVRLHSALLDWQEELLDEAVPGRAVYALMDQEQWPSETDPGLARLAATLRARAVGAQPHQHPNRRQP
jgi:hypothetical protein